MSLKSLEISGFKSFAKKGELSFTTPVTGIVGPNGSGKSNVAESFRFVLGEQSVKSLRGKKTEDLIWNGSEALPRQSRASVKLTFDNRPNGGKRLLNMDFDEVSIERTIHRDSLSEYAINGTQVRLKDIVELLAGAHIGASGHHIISQGEADRILNSNPKERREMIMDALGLKIYQYKREESERKLEKTRENMERVESLRREIAPHLKFLKKQVEKVEKTIEMRNELRALYREYLSREKSYLDHEEKTVAGELEIPTNKLSDLEHRLDATKKAIEAARKDDVGSRELVEIEKKLRMLREKKDEAARSLGRIEGEIAGLVRVAEKESRAAAAAEARPVPYVEIEKFFADFTEEIENAESASTVSEVKAFLSKARAWIRDFLVSAKQGKAVESMPDTKKEIDALKERSSALEKHMHEAVAEEKTAQKEYESIREKIEKEKDSSRDAERDMFRIMAEENEIRTAISMLRVREEKVRGEREAMKREIEEGMHIVGREVYAYENEHHAHDSREEQEKRRKNIEKIKIRLEDSGAVSAEEVMKEFKETSERDMFLEKELADLAVSATSLEALMTELETKLNTLFEEGIHKINTQFKEFFVLMFGGGTAGLKVVEEKKRKRRIIADDEDEAVRALEAEPEEEETETGVDIDISLPRKKVKSLEMLSGGERALTSIALIFALSQVNPPPFLVLDETDAALDEANSKKYGDMIALLSKHSQLIVVTHNRETMSRAGVLYGVTMGKEGASKLLSIAFETAVAVAK